MDFIIWRLECSFLYYMNVYYVTKEFAILNINLLSITKNPFRHSAFRIFPILYNDVICHLVQFSNLHPHLTFFIICLSYHFRPLRIRYIILKYIALTELELNLLFLKS